MTAVPYENLEMHLGRKHILDEKAFATKIIEKNRGGWCFEMNGLLTNILKQIGFEVTRVASCIEREKRGDEGFGNHLVGLVDLDKRYVVDLGLGRGPLSPYPLEEREWSEEGFQFRLERLDDRWWRFHNHEDWPSHDFTEEPRDLTWFQKQCTKLQTNTLSTFVNWAIVILRTRNGFECLTDTEFIQNIDNTKTKETIQEQADYAKIMRGLLGQDLGDEVQTLWMGAKERSHRRAQAEAEDS
jgi:N-hydroxyarylamine O-acetyltransferase